MLDPGRISGCAPSCTPVIQVPCGIQGNFCEWYILKVVFLNLNIHKISYNLNYNLLALEHFLNLRIEER